MTSFLHNMIHDSVVSAWDWDERGDYLIDTSDDILIDVLEIQSPYIWGIGYARSLDDFNYIIECMLGDPADYDDLVTDLKVTVTQTKMTDREWNALEPYEGIL